MNSSDAAREFRNYPVHIDGHTEWLTKDEYDALACESCDQEGVTRDGYTCEECHGSGLRGASRV